MHNKQLDCMDSNGTMTSAQTRKWKRMSVMFVTMLDTLTSSKRRT